MKESAVENAEEEVQCYMGVPFPGRWRGGSRRGRGDEVLLGCHVRWWCGEECFVLVVLGMNLLIEAGLIGGCQDIVIGGGDCAGQLGLRELEELERRKIRRGEMESFSPMGRI